MVEKFCRISILRLGKFFRVQVPQLRSNHLIPHRKASLDIRRVSIVRCIKYQFILPSRYSRNKVPIKSPTGGGP